MKSWETLWRGARLLFGSAPGMVAGYFAIVCLSGILPVMQVGILPRLIDALTHAQNGVSYMVGYLVAFGGVIMLEPLEASLISRLQMHSVAVIDRALMQAGQRLTDLERIESAAFQDDLRLVQERVFRLFWSFRFIRNGLVTILVLGGVLILLASIQPVLALFLLLVSSPHIWAERHGAVLRERVMAKYSRAARMMDYDVQVLTTPQTAKEVRIFRLGPFFAERFAVSAHRGLAELTQTRLAQLRFTLICSLGYAVVLGGGFWYVAIQASHQLVTLGVIALYVGAMIQAQSRLWILALVVGRVSEFHDQMRGLLTFLDQAQAHILVPTEGRVPPMPLRDGVRMNDVSFQYPSQDRPVLADITAHVPVGRLTAVVGINGAGKTTLVKLLARLYEPTQGTLTLDSTHIAALDIAALRGSMAFVSQDFARLSLTCADNITVGGVAVPGHTRDLTMAAQFAGADVVVAKLPEGYATPLTTRFPGGVEISGGEWQRIALARAFIRDAPLLVLDEPTAALDAEAEEHLIARLRTIAHGKTVILISHRLSTIKLADHILVLEQGQICEAGTHRELLAAHGRYAALYQMQAEQYPM